MGGRRTSWRSKTRACSRERIPRRSRAIGRCRPRLKSWRPTCPRMMFRRVRRSSRTPGRQRARGGADHTAGLSIQRRTRKFHLLTWMRVRVDGQVVVVVVVVWERMGSTRAYRDSRRSRDSRSRPSTFHPSREDNPPGGGTDEGVWGCSVMSVRVGFGFWLVAYRGAILVA